MAFNHNLFPFKRTKTEFQGGDCPYSVHNPDGDSMYRDAGPVTIIKAVGDPDDDLWQVRNERGDTFNAFGHDMHPRPDGPETNIEALTRLMENGSTVMVQAFIMEGAIKYAEQVLADEEATRAAMQGGMIGAQSWIDTAKEVRDFLNQHLRPGK